MKVLHFCSYYRPLGGAEKLLFNVLHLLEQHGIENVVVAPKTGANGPTGARKEYFVDFLEYPFSRSSLCSTLTRNWALVQSLRKIVQTEKPDVLHLHNQQNPFVYLACLLSGIPMVRNVHDPRLYCPTHWRLLPDGSLCSHAFGRACVTEGCVKPRLADARHLMFTIFNRQLSFWNTTLIIESRESWNMAIQNGYRESQLCLIPNCTPIAPLAEAVATKERLNASSQNTLLFVGRASYEKGLHFLLHALPKVRNDFKLYILTAGDYYNSTIAPLVTELGLASKVEVRFDTSYSGTADFYAMADIVLIPSIWFETFCMVGIEAYAHLTPVIATRTGGIKDWCVHGETGFLVNIFDEDDLARRIDELLDDPALRRTFGLNGYRRVQDNYTETIYFERLHALYEKVTLHGKSDSYRLPRLARRAV